MTLILGGAYQGKTAYAKKQYALSDDQIADGTTYDLHAPEPVACIAQYHRLIYRLLETGMDPIRFSEALLHKNPQLIILMDEIGNGIIPMEKQERIWREKTGQTGCYLAACAETVIRMICGIAVPLKGSSV